MPKKRVYGDPVKRYLIEQQKRYRKDNPAGYHKLQARYHLRKLNWEDFVEVVSMVQKEIAISKAVLEKVAQDGSHKTMKEKG